MIFYFSLKAIFVLKIFKFLFSIFGHVGKCPDKKATLNFKIYDKLDDKQFQYTYCQTSEEVDFQLRGSCLSPQGCLYFRGFWDSSFLGLMVAQQFDQVTYLCEEYNNFQDSKSIFMISYFKIFPIMLLRKLNFGVFSLYFTFIAKEKLPFSLVCRFSCCLVKEG